MSEKEETVIEEEEITEEEVTTEPAATVATPTPQADELKLVIIIKGNRATIGVQAPDCDPVFETAEGALSEILVHAHIAVDNARSKWATSKRNPKADLPKPVAPPTPVRTATTPAAKKTATTKAATTQPKFF